jgi:hypothetical protein
MLYEAYVKNYNCGDFPNLDKTDAMRKSAVLKNELLNPIEILRGYF